MLHTVKCTLHAVGYNSDRLSADFCIGYRQSFITVFIKQFYFAILRDGLVMPSRRVLNVCEDFQSIKCVKSVFLVVK